MYGSIIALQLSSGVAESWLTVCADIGAKGIAAAAAATPAAISSLFDGAPTWCEVSSCGPWTMTDAGAAAASSPDAQGPAAPAPEVDIPGVTRKRRVPRIVHSCAFRVINAHSPADRSSIMSHDAVAFELIVNGRATGWCLGARVSARAGGRACRLGTLASGLAQSDGLSTLLPPPVAGLLSQAH